MSVIDDYLQQVDSAHRQELERLRAIVVAMAPEATEVISYGMPGFKYKTKYLITFAAFKDHYSLFPGAGPVEELKPELQDYGLSKGTIAYDFGQAMPVDLVKRIVKLCIERIDQAKT